MIDFRFVCVSDNFVPTDDGSKSKVKFAKSRCSFVSICKDMGMKQLIYMCVLNHFFDMDHSFIFAP